MAKETQKSIAEWADATFGEPVSNESIALRAQREMRELIDILAVNDTSPRAVVEIADIYIVLARLLERLGCPDIQAIIDFKMDINRHREWVLDGNGHGQHV